MARQHTYAICVSNRGYAAALEVRKVYRLLPDESLKGRGLVRVVDESAEEYVYPARFFVPIEVPGPATRAFSTRSA